MYHVTYSHAHKNGITLQVVAEERQQVVQCGEQTWYIVGRNCRQAEQAEGLTLRRQVGMQNEHPREEGPT